MNDTPPRRVVVVDYGMGNLRSVAKITSRTGAEVRVSSDPADIEWAERLILPGVGAFPDAMAELARRDLTSALNEAVCERGKPILGICLGMELMAKESEEVRPTQGLGWLDARMVSFDRSNEFRVPHVGWNQLTIRRACPLLDGVEDASFYYFVHSYHMVCSNASLIIATSHYGQEFVAAVRHGNIYGTQFHPEKSQAKGFLVLMNFVTKDII